MYKKIELEKLIPQYVALLDKVDVSKYADYEFSKKYLDTKEKIIRMRKKVYYPLIKTTGRRIAVAIIAAVMMGSVTAMSYEPVREAIKGFFIRAFNGYSIVTTVDGDLETDNHKKTIEKEYNITVPQEYYLLKTESVWTDGYIWKNYYTEDREKYIDLGQYVKSVYSTNIDNEQAQLIEKKDKYGNKILVHNIDDITVTIIWDNGEYVFNLLGNCSEDELMEVYYSLK